MSSLDRYQLEVRAMAIIAWSVWNKNPQTPTKVIMKQPLYLDMSVSSHQATMNKQAQTLTVHDDQNNPIGASDFDSRTFYGAYEKIYEQQFKFEFTGSDKFRIEDVRTSREYKRYDLYEGEFVDNHRLKIWPSGEQSEGSFEFEIY